MRETRVRSLGWEDPLETGKATHSSILARWIPWTVSMGPPKVGYDWATFTPCVCVYYQLVFPALHFTSACFHFCTLFPGSHSSSSGWPTFGTPLFLTPLFLWLFAPCPLPLITTAFSFSSSIFQWAFFFRFPFFYNTTPSSDPALSPFTPLPWLPFNLWASCCLRSPVLFLSFLPSLRGSQTLNLPPQFFPQSSLFVFPILIPWVFRFTFQTDSRPPTPIFTLPHLPVSSSAPRGLFPSAPPHSFFNPHLLPPSPVLIWPL